MLNVNVSPLGRDARLIPRIMPRRPQPPKSDTPLAARLQIVMQAMGWSQTDLMRASKQSSSVVSQWLGKGSKQINEIGKVDAAVYLERATGFSAVWIALGEGPQRIGSVWPFRFDRSRFDALDEREKGMVEHAAMLELERLETGKKGAAAPPRAA